MPTVRFFNPRFWSEPYLLIQNLEACYRVLVSDIVYCTAHNSSAEFTLADGHTLVSAHSLCYYESLLESYGFCRIHKGYLLNLAHLRTLCKRDETNTVLLTNGEKILVARHYKMKLLQQLKQNSIEGETDEKEIKRKGVGIPNSRQMLPVDGKNIPDTHSSSTENKNK